MEPKELISDGNGGHLWKGSNDRFQGYTVRALEDITSTVKEMKETNEMQWKVIVKNKERLDVMKGQTRAQAVMVSFAVGGVTFLVTLIVTNLDKIARFFGGS